MGAVMVVVGDRFLSEDRSRSGDDSTVADAPGYGYRVKVRVEQEVPPAVRALFGDHVPMSPAAVWNSEYQTINYVSRTAYSSSDACAPVATVKVSAEGNVALDLQDTTGTPGLACRADAHRVTVVIAIRDKNGFVEAPTRVTVTEKGQTTTIPVRYPPGSVIQF